jgi:hypothetical protein
MVVSKYGRFKIESEKIFLLYIPSIIRQSSEIAIFRAGISTADDIKQASS